MALKKSSYEPATAEEKPIKALYYPTKGIKDIIDSTKLKKLTGWTPEYTFESMLDEMVEYWLNHYKLNKN